MALSLVPKFNRNQIIQAIAGRKQLIEDAILMRLQRTGEKFIKNARLNASFTDRTGNLRSSFGYIIIKNGSDVAEGFAGGKGKEGKEAAQRVIEEVKQKFPSGYVLIGVAGMEYAAAVESLGYDVITGSSQQAEIELRKAMVELGNKLSKSKTA